MFQFPSLLPEISFSLPGFGEDEFSSAEHLGYSHFLGF